MCVALPGKVIEISGDIAKADFSGNLLEVRTGLVDIAVGDYVLVHAGCVIQKVSTEEALRMEDLMREIESFGGQ